MILIINNSPALTAAADKLAESGCWLLLQIRGRYFARSRDNPTKAEKTKMGGKLFEAASMFESARNAYAAANADEQVKEMQELIDYILLGKYTLPPDSSMRHLFALDESLPLYNDWTAQEDEECMDHALLRWTSCWRE